MNRMQLTKKVFSLLRGFYPKLSYGWYLPVVFSFAMLFAAFKSPVKDPCLEEVKAVYKKMANRPIVPGKVLYLNYTVSSATTDSTNNGLSVATVETWMDEKHLQVKSKEMEVYQDENDVFTVLPQRKMLLRADVDKNAGKDRYKQMSFFQDTLFSLSSVSACRDMNAAKTEKVIVLSPNATGRKLFHISKITFFIQTEQQEVKKVRVDYLPKQQGGKGNEIAYVEYLINEMNFDYKKKKPGSNVKKMFMRSETELNSSYKGYKYVDNRNRR